MRMTFVMLEHYEKAINDLSHALNLHPNNAGYYSDRGYSKHMLKHYKEAIEDYDQAIFHGSKNADDWYNKACAYSMLNNKEKIYECLEKAINLDPSLKNSALKDEEFINIRGEDQFKKILGIN